MSGHSTQQCWHVPGMSRRWGRGG